MDKNNDILQMLRDREQEFHLPLPTDGWEKLEARLLPPVPPLQSLHAAGKAHHRMWVRGWVAASVAVLCMLCSLPLLMRQERGAAVPGPGAKPLVAAEVPASQPREAEQSGQASQLPASLPDTTDCRSVARPVEVPLLAETDLVLSLTDTLMELPQLVELPAAPARSTRKDIGPQPETRPEGHFDSWQTAEGMKLHRRPWSVGVQTGSYNLSAGKGGLSGIDRSFTSPGEKPDPKPEPDPTEPEGPQSKASVGGSAGGGGDTYYYYRHRLPITVSFSLRRTLLPKLAVETGLSYTYLYSEILEEEVTHTDHQQLHYLGIPLKLSWTFFDRSAFSLYATGGAMLEYCLAARNTLHDLDINRWQPSLQAAVGMQVALPKPWSLFVEPGIGYYFNTNRYQSWHSGQPFETIRMVHPLTFSLQLGVRFTY